MPFPILILYSFSVLGSGIGFVSQSLIAGFWVTTYSNDVFYFSLSTAFYFLSLGVGSLLSNRWKKPTPSLLLWLTITLSLLAGYSIPVLKLCIQRLGNVFPLALFWVCLMGIVAGQLIPLTLRVGRNYPTLSLSKLFFCDYLAAIGFTLSFTLLLLIPNGYGLTSFYLGTFGVFACVVLAARGRLVSVHLLGVIAASYVLYLQIPKATLPLEGNAKILHEEQSHYQKIVLTEEAEGNYFFPGIRKHTLYLDGFVQFSSISEQNYHACLVNVPLAAAEFGGHPVRTVLILGGGDGLAARNLLAVPKIKRIVQVEIDPAMIRLAQGEAKVRMYNLDSLRSPKVEIKIEDAFTWVRTAKEKFDLLVVDFPAPKNLTLSRLFTAEFYSQLTRLVNPEGMISIQAGPSFSTEDSTLDTLSKVTTCIKRTLVSIGKAAEVYVNSRDNEAFVLVPMSAGFNSSAFFKKAGMYGGQKEVAHLCVHSPDWKEPSVRVNTLNTLTLSTYMLSWFQTVGGEFFKYRDGHAIFLPN